jgi:hypothetical protein
MSRASRRISGAVARRRSFGWGGTGGMGTAGIGIGIGVGQACSVTRCGRGPQMPER